MVIKSLVVVVVVVDSQEKMKQVCNAVDDLEQHTRKYDLEFHGIGEEKKEDIEEHIVKLGKVLKVNIKNSDIIDISHGMNCRRSPTPIILRFIARKVKQSIYFAKKHLKKVDLSKAFPKQRQNLYKLEPDCSTPQIIQRSKGISETA